MFMLSCNPPLFDNQPKMSIVIDESKVELMALKLKTKYIHFKIVDDQTLTAPL